MTSVLTFDRVESADIKMCLLSLDGDLQIDPVVQQVIDKDTFVILNKQDALVNQEQLTTLKTTLNEMGVKNIWTMSCTTGQGLDVFLNQMIDILKLK
jgi:tRNA modification GTPase